MGQIVTVNFRGDELYGFRGEGGEYVALRPIVEALGLNWAGQLQRVKRDPILSEGVCMMHIPFARGGTQEAACLRLDLVNGWLFTVDTNRIRDDATREKALAYQREAYRVLARAFGVTAQPEAGAADIAYGTACNLITEARRSYGKAAARELWPKLGLPMTPAMLAVLAAAATAPAQGTLFPAEGGR